MSREKQAIRRPTLVMDKQTGKWQVSYTCPVQGYTKKLSTGTADKKQALAKLRAMAVEIIAPPPVSADYTAGAILLAYEVEQYGPDGKGGVALTRAA